MATTLAIVVCVVLAVLLMALVGLLVAEAERRLWVADWRRKMEAPSA